MENVSRASGVAAPVSPGGAYIWLVGFIIVSCNLISPLQLPEWAADLYRGEGILPFLGIGWE